MALIALALQGSLLTVSESGLPVNWFVSGVQFSSSLSAASISVKMATEEYTYTLLRVIKHFCQH